VTDQINIRTQDREIVEAILRTVLPPGSEVFVFGSRATGRGKRSSDLDLAINAMRPLTRAEDLALSDAFDESDLPYTVDIVDLTRDHPRFRDIVRNDGVKLKLTP
jgi:type I restriction enzyme S subunit